MQLKLLQVHEAFEAMKRIGKKVFTADVAYRFSKNKRTLEVESNAYLEQLNELLKKYKFKHVDGKPGLMAPEDPTKLPKANAEIEKLRNETVEIEDIKMIPFSLIDSIAPDDVEHLEFMFEFYDENESKKADVKPSGLEAVLKKPPRKRK
jgi:hypothetical protein